MNQLLTYDQFRHCYRNVIVANRYDQQQVGIAAKTLMHKAMLTALAGTTGRVDAADAGSGSREFRLVWCSRILAATLCDLYSRYGSYADNAWSELVTTAGLSVVDESALLVGSDWLSARQHGRNLHDDWEQWVSLITSKKFVQEIKALLDLLPAAKDGADGK
jgi:hypothetical protein